MLQSLYSMHDMLERILGVIEDQSGEMLDDNTQLKEKGKEEQPALVRQPSIDQRTTIFLDIDQCSCYGEDFNDLITACQMSLVNYNRIQELITQLLNPSMIHAMNTIFDALGKKNVRVVLYTAKSGLVLPLEDYAVIPGSLVYIPSATTVEDLSKKNKAPASWLGIVRLMIAERAIRSVLGIEEKLEILITKVRKSVKIACENIVPLADYSRAWLFDDNEAIANDLRVQTVNHFNALYDTEHNAVMSNLRIFFGDDLKLNERAAKFCTTGPRPGHTCYSTENQKIHVYKTGDETKDVWPIPGELVIREVSLKEIDDEIDVAELRCTEEEPHDNEPRE
jgi:hypothetical protein